ncbi:MAG: hypothetical protein COZ31_11815 [Nitrospirae bacterium CG_4_10_14_3_um_filter_44_29]|nr:hypothetical protein [Nitrospirota bacterium]OIO28925.1 MAG: hypothetical protein AUJ60_06215 [Nitrospirae bacterium CG1_02_44_142]PIP71093.1 MAG: hypothetical protein COW90_01825 [Nitrospirae bacterium CG22_combo_CG10-13_8_21_14_all_44_11]PIV40777.1 MAG: hypothetical protein COS28_07150 [Nitrospirae bacterium CG02_land_8_20_14_3_00_44_33]PIV66863.1 MAG: hypothetical protein COS10_04080 [Nitrospirae bacterium CG01_land_8_20_14_3_00_44_22]PIX87172.1 MAG: hypothetical protein COZ31_11815 [Nit
MPVLKYKTFEDAEKNLWNFAADDNYFKMVLSLNSTMFKQTIVRDFPHGVHKYKFLKDAQKEMENWLMKRA